VKRPTMRYTPEAAGHISRLHPEIKALIRIAIDELRANPFLGDDLQGALFGFKSCKPRRYRILYKFEEEGNTIDVYYVGHRRDIYERFGQLLRELQGPFP
jgi:mRNA-degrading endonuclease RelE of RelBE toxin-antitoxin system